MANNYYEIRQLFFPNKQIDIIEAHQVGRVSMVKCHGKLNVLETDYGK